MTTGEKIREARLSAGLTQKRLSELTGIAEPTIRKYESNRLNPKKETLEKIALPLSVHYLSLYGDDRSNIIPFLKENVIPPSEPTMAEIEQKAAALGMTVTEYLLSNPETEELGHRFAARDVRLSKNLALSSLTPKERIDSAFDLLNGDGQEKAAESVEIIAGNPKYQRQAPSEGKDTTTPSDGQQGAQEGEE